MSGSVSFRSFAIVPAAGRSRRMGRPKLLLPWGARTVIECVISAWQASRVTRCIVTVHPADEELARTCRMAGADVVVADPPPLDMKESIARGLDRIAQLWSPAPHDAWLVAPADLPLLSAAAIDQVLAAHEPLRPTIVVPQCGGRRGHPVLFPWELAAEVGLLPPDAGVNDLLRRHPPRAIDCAAAAFADDIDTPEDYRRLQSNPPRPH